VVTSSDADDMEGIGGKMVETTEIFPLIFCLRLLIKSDKPTTG